jgi:hypothetical protein
MPKCPFDGCKKKIALTDTACKCGKVYCSAHRHFIDHSCSFDFKEDAKQILLKTMSTAVIAKKVDVV